MEREKETMESIIGQLRETLARMELALGAIDQGIIWTNSQGNIIWCNDFFVKLVKKPRIMVINQPINSILDISYIDLDFTTSKNLIDSNIAKEKREKLIYSYCQEYQELVLEINCFEFCHSLEGTTERGMVLVVKDLSNTIQKDQNLREAKNKIIEILKIEKELASSLKQKEILLKEIHHRVKNNLLVISSLIDWQSESLEDPHLISVMEDSKKRIQAMALIHEKMYRSDNLSHIELGQYLQDLALTLYDSLNLDSERISISFDLDVIFVNIETAIPCGLIVNELISNSLEHGFPDLRKGNISLKLSVNNLLDDSKITLIVEDDGIGFPPNFDLNQSDSLGLQLVDLLAQQLEAELSIEHDNGTRFTINFSELKYTSRV